MTPAPTQAPADSETAQPDNFAQLITFRAAAALLPRRRGGRPTNVSSLFRWSNQGCRGSKLRYVWAGGVRCTTREWLAEFFEAMTAASALPRHDSSPPVPGPRPTAARRAAQAAAERELDRLGI